MKTAALLLALPVRTLADFMTSVNGKSTACSYTYNGNEYDHCGTYTTTSEDYWVPNTYDGKYPSNYDLHYNRVSTTSAVGSRCETPVMDSISGDGIFEATVYIHSTVASGSGVFTIAAISEPFDSAHEIDLIVINLQDDVMKSGSPGKAYSFDLSKWDKKWIDITMTKSGNVCSTKISNANPGASHSGFNETGAGSSVMATGDCALHSANKLVVNSRARNGTDSDGDSFVSVLAVSWTQM